MKKTTILRLIALVMCIPFAFSLISCGETEKQTTATTATTSPAPNPVAYSKIAFEIGGTWSYINNDDEILEKWNLTLYWAKETDKEYVTHKTKGCVDVIVLACGPDFGVIDEINQVENFKYEKASDGYLASDNKIRITYTIKYEDVDFEVIKELTRNTKIESICIHCDTSYVAPPDGIVSASIRYEKIHFNIGKADYMDIEDYAEFEEAIAYVNSDAVKDEYLTVRVTIAEGLDTEKEFSKLSEDILGSVDVEMIENTSCADIKVSKYDNDILILLIWLSDCESVADITVSLPAAE